MTYFCHMMALFSFITKSTDSTDEHTKKLHEGKIMNLLNQIATHIHTLNSGEQWTVTAQELLISRADFQSLSVFLSREAEKGEFSLQISDTLRSWLGCTSVTVIKN